MKREKRIFHHLQNTHGINHFCFTCGIFRFFRTTLKELSVNSLGSIYFHSILPTTQTHSSSTYGSTTLCSNTLPVLCLMAVGCFCWYRWLSMTVLRLSTSQCSVGILGAKKCLIRMDIYYPPLHLNVHWVERLFLSSAPQTLSKTCVLFLIL